jgi:long-chain acyl-CoA synthetase
LPVPGTRVKITDPNDPNITLKLNEVGEICISGPQVMKGYYNREKETDAVMHDGWLRTGDMGFMDDEYYLHIVDRKKRLILVNGFNVYPTQIEQAISKHPAVAECIVISVPDSRSGEAAKAFIRLKRTAENKPDATQMREFLSEYLGRIELPKHIEFVDEELPKTAVGKPDWRSLQDRERLHMLAIGPELPSTDLDMEQAS